MIPPGFVSLRMVFTKLCEVESKTRGRGPAVAPEAANRLLYFLIDGRLRACRFAPNGTKDDIPTEYWNGQARTFARTIVEYDAFGEIVVSAEELALLISGSNGGPSGESESHEAKPGRKPKYEPNSLAIVLAMTVYSDGFAESQEKMIEKVQYWHEQIYGPGSEPGRTALQPIIRRLFLEKSKHDARDPKAGK
jgi:hypothetical protein